MKWSGKVITLGQLLSNNEMKPKELIIVKHCQIFVVLETRENFHARTKPFLHASSLYPIKRNRRVASNRRQNAGPKSVWFIPPYISYTIDINAQTICTLYIKTKTKTKKFLLNKGTKTSHAVCDSWGQHVTKI